MNWLVRFLIGLPARKEDLDELKQAIPELFNQDIESIEFTRQQIKSICPILFNNCSSEELLGSLKKWIRNIEKDDKYMD